jgi:hypothetical protein
LVDEVVKELETAARSSAGTLARLTRSGSGGARRAQRVHVVLVRQGRE